MTFIRKLGTLEVSSHGLGCWAIGGPFWAGEQPLGWARWTTKNPSAPSTQGWIWGRNPVTIPIPGFRTVKRVTENVGALAFSSLTGEQVKEIDAILGR